MKSLNFVFCCLFWNEFCMGRKALFNYVSKKEHVLFLNDNFIFKNFWSLNLIFFFNVKSLTADTSIPVVIGRVSCYQFKSNYLKKLVTFCSTFIAFLEATLNFEHFEKK